MSEILPAQMKTVSGEVHRILDCSDKPDITKIKCIFECVFHFALTTLWTAVRLVDDAETLIADDEDFIGMPKPCPGWGQLIPGSHDHDDDLHVDPGSTGSFGDWSPEWWCAETPEAVVRDDDDDDDLEWADGARADLAVGGAASEVPLSWPCDFAGCKLQVVAPFAFLCDLAAGSSWSLPLHLLFFSRGMD